ncbi:MAG: triose-phosphate isomerase [Alphaproteobacteria bacterium]|nr:triose-phosphate isomerase [Alphaproteobacteria bacterium]
MRQLIVGNWKMNGLKAESLARASEFRAFAEAEKPACDLLVCPPATLVEAVAKALAGSAIAVGGQDCHTEDKGAFTGDIAAAMVGDLGCRYVIVGHSERRRDHGENDTRVGAKATAAHRAGLMAIVCLGESAAERDAGRAETVVAAQLEGSWPQGGSPANTVVAYEPVWAIGTGRTPTVAEIAAIHGLMRTLIVARLGSDGHAVRLLYGGSVGPRNAAEILAIPNVDGALVGGASLKIEDFAAIARSCQAR